MLCPTQLPHWPGPSKDSSAFPCTSPLTRRRVALRRNYPASYKLENTRGLSTKVKDEIRAPSIIVWFFQNQTLGEGLGCGERMWGPPEGAHMGRGVRTHRVGGLQRTATEEPEESVRAHGKQPLAAAGVPPLGAAQRAGPLDALCVSHCGASSRTL